MKDIKEIIIGKPLEITHGASTLPQMIFRDIPGRSDIDQIIVGHIGNRIITLNLEELRSLVLFMQPFFEAKQINKGATVMLISIPGSTEIMTAVYAIALACRGVRVCMPMQTSKEELGEWVALTQATHAILPSREINDLEGHELEKNHLEAIVHILREKNVEVWDSVMSFPLYHAMVSGTYHTLSHSPWENVLPPVSPFDEALILTTSGSTGKSRLVVYEHISFALGCMAWSQAGLYEDHRMGGASFTPQVAHSMGVMGIMNAIWSGKPACLISVDMFFTDPVTAVELLLSMNPKVITGGPGVFKIFKGVLETFPEARDTLLANDKVFVNCDAELDPVLGKTLHHYIWNAFSSTETMMALTTMLQPHAKKGSLGAPLPGISISLREYDKERELYTMHIKSAFGCSRVIGQNVPIHFVNTGDLVKLNASGDIIYAGRTKMDVMKDDFGVKIPMNVLNEYFHDIASHSVHTEWFTLNGYPGACALVFRDVDDNEPLRDWMNRGNMLMMKKLDPLSFAHCHLSRIGIVHQPPPLTAKGSVSRKMIREEWADFIELLRDRSSNSIDIIPSSLEEINEEEVATSTHAETRS